MERRNFFKKIAGVIAGLVIAPIVVKSQETAGYIHEAEWEYVPHWTEIHKRIVQDPNAGYIHDTNEATPQFSNNKYEFGDPEDFRIVRFTAEGDAYEFPKSNK